jgi:hypothetical protein
MEHRTLVVRFFCVDVIRQYHAIFCRYILRRRHLPSAGESGMRARLGSLLWAIVVVTLTVCVVVVSSYTGPAWLARVSVVPIGWALMLPLVFCGGLHGCDLGPWYWPTAFVLAVLMWWLFVEAVRYLWRRRRRRSA